ncbi:glucose-1-phosphate adenylyltransferase large subunit 1 [Musa acuminata AAA Group]|uniref:glucose-1-phosphate adenylyltransferase large subunit 1 n=1 Tax=Musa acuminata AAA Group TaxID=214697 RepID=UPI0031DC8E09
MMDASSVGLKSSACLSQIKGGVLDAEESGFAVGSRIMAWKPKVVRSAKNCCSWVGEFKAGAGVFAITSAVNKETVFQAPRFGKHKPDARSVASIILGGGAGAQLFPLTSTRATPAVPVGGCYRLIDIPMSNCINSGINKIFIMTQFNSASLNRHIYRTFNFGNGINFGDGFVEVLAATQTPGESGMNWFQGTAYAVRQFTWVFEDNRNMNIQYILILSGDQLYRMDYMDFVQKHVDTGADITISCVPVGASRASDYGLIKIDKAGKIIQFSEKPKGGDLETMKDENTLFRLSHQDAKKYPYIASMGVYVFNRNTLLELLRWTYPKANDFGSDILPSAVKDYNVQAYIFKDYWEDIRTIKSFYDANLALTDQPPKFQFYDPRTPIFTSPQFLPPNKIEQCRIRDAIISHGCFLHECSIEHSVVGMRSRVDYGAELKHTLMMGADVYETEAEIASLLAEGKVPIGVGENTKIRNCIIDMNARIGKNVVIANRDGVQEADRPSEGFYIRSGITTILKSATVKDGTVI